MTYNVFSGTLNPTHFTSLRNFKQKSTYSMQLYRQHWIIRNNVPTVAIVFKLALVKLHSKIRSLKIQRDHLAAGIPENLQ